jgi:hypothetical protein
MIPDDAKCPGESPHLVDAIARATHLWVRQLEPATLRWREVAHLAFVGGMISGLCDGANQPPHVRTWVAYVYALLDGAGCDALRLADEIVAAAANVAHGSDFERGRAESGGIMSWLRLPDHG